MPSGHDRTTSTMSAIDINAMLAEVSPEQPCGDNLEYDPAFSELELAARGKEEQTLGDATVPAEPPDWREVRDHASELLGRTRDLRLVVYLARALLNTDGLAGFSDGLSLLRGMLERHWECVHPQLDPEDNKDPTFRVNTIVTLCDRDATLHYLQAAPLVSSRALGSYGLRSLLMAKGELSPTDDEDAADLATIDAAFMDADIDELKTTAEALTRTSGDLAAVDAVLMEKLGATEAPDLDALSGMLKSMQAVMDEHLARRGVGEAPDEAADGQGPAGARAVSGAINSREDAVRMMEKISDYFERNEPSSPVPLLMRRAKRLVSMNFMDILKDMAPKGVSEAASIGGVSEE